MKLHIVCYISIILFFYNSRAYAQKIYEANDRFGSAKGKCIAVLEQNKVFKADGAFCSKGDCLFIVENDRVFQSQGAFCSFRGDCLYVFDKGLFYKSADAFGNYVDQLVFIFENDRIYESYYNSGRGKCIYIIENNKVYNSQSQSGMIKGDCVLIMEGPPPIAALLSLLARRF